MNDQITSEQKKAYIFEALVKSGFERVNEMEIFTKEHDGKRIIVADLTAGKSVVFKEGTTRISTDDEEGTLLKVSKIITKAEDGQMPTISEPSEVVNVPKKDEPAPAHIPESNEPEVFNPPEPAQDMTGAGNVPTVPESAQACAPTEIIPPRMMPYSMNQIQTIKNTVAKGINDSELEMFLHISQAYGLDPFLKEIFYSSQLKTIMTSRDGYLKVAQRDPTFEGIQSMAVCENDDFEVDVANHTVKHKFGKGDRGKVIGGWAIVAKTGRNPVIAFADLREYKKSNNVWQTYPSAMICKVAEVFALKRQFGISGLVTQEELE